MALTFPSFNNNPASTSTFSFGSSSAFGTAAASAPAFPSFGAPSTGTSLFSSSASTQQSASSFPSFSFSNSAASASAAPSTSFGSTSLFALPNAATATAPAAVLAAPQSLSLTSTYASLPEDVRNVFLGLEKHIRQQSSLAEELNAALPPVGAVDAVGSVSGSVSGLSSALVEVRVLMSEDLERVEAVQREVEADIRQAEGSHRRGMRLAHVGQAGQSASHMQDTLYLPSHFHWQRLAECEKRLEAVHREMADVEGCLHSVHSPLAAASAQQDSLASLAGVLQNQHNLLVDVSSRIAARHSHIDAMRIVRTARNPPSVDDARRLLASAPTKTTLDSFGTLTTTTVVTPVPAGATSASPYAPLTSVSAPLQPSMGAGWGGAPAAGVGGGANVTSTFGASSPYSAFTTAPFSLGQQSSSSFSSLPSSTSSSFSTAPLLSGFGSSSFSFGSLPSLPSAPPALTSSISATAEGGQYRTIRSGGSSKTVVRRK